MSVFRFIGFSVLVVLLGTLVALTLWPQGDLAVSALFYREGAGFVFRDSWGVLFLNGLAVEGSRLMAAAFALLAGIAGLRRAPVWHLSAKGWGFLFVALVVGPGLVANVGLKDHWGRARPREVTQFGGTSAFTPALVISDACQKNCSFVAGDGAFGFFLPTFAYLVAIPKRRRVFGWMMGVGAVFGGARVGGGAHFLSDVLYALFLMLGTSAGVHAAFYGRQATLSFWKSLIESKPEKA